MLRWIWKEGARRCLLIITSLVMLSGLPVFADTVPKSTNYSFDESSVGMGGMLEANSTNYRATETSGDIAVGRASSANYQVIAGSKTTPDPVLAVAILNGNGNFGLFSASTTATTTTSFLVKNYTTYGYVVQIQGQPPTHDGHALPAMTVAGSSQTGIEQFGLNLVANTQPTSLGANPDNGQFGYGQVAADYATPNTYKYTNGETIAYASKDSGETTYTISYIANVAGLTPGGQYTSAQTLIVVGTY